ncbi:hypothetical protein [Falsiroseomonas sp. E2-1-a20]|uniref:hypothetical protein n=1 Tax=Falsiroseomonas sp. E2-1-a20 TaxID=3239300 RepID=UPI003F2CC598
MAQPDRASTFAERGVAVPFTTPMLAGARLRRAATGESELVLAGLGGRGIYVLEWEAAVGLASPTLHDHQLWPHLAALPTVTPARVRQAACSVAAIGLAGRDAAAAAMAALAVLMKARERAEQRLGGASSPLMNPQQVQPCRSGLVELLATIEAGAGDVLGGRHAAIERLGVELLALAEKLPDGPERRAATLVAAGARLTLAALPCCLRPLHASLLQLPARLAGDERVLAEIVEQAGRLDLLLDGWSGLVALWDEIPSMKRRDFLGDLLAALPVPAREADDWSGLLSGWDSLASLQRRLPLKPSWARGGRMALIALHEARRARAP